MDFLNGKPYRFLEVATNLLILNLLWLICCIPVITIFPATAAMFGVMREWHRQSDTAIVQPFFRQFKINFGQSLLLELVWAAVAALLVLDYLIVSNAGDPIKFVLYLVLALFGLIYLLASVFLFPVLVTYKESWLGIIKNSLLIAISQLGITVLCIIIWALTLALILYYPISITLAGGVSTLALYTLCRRAFLNIERQKGIELERSS